MSDAQEEPLAGGAGIPSQPPWAGRRRRARGRQEKGREGGRAGRRKGRKGTGEWQAVRRKEERRRAGRRRAGWKAGGGQVGR